MPLTAEPETRLACRLFLWEGIPGSRSGRHSETKEGKQLRMSAGDV